MLPVLSIGSIKTSGSTTLALTLAGVAAAADIPVVLVDAARDRDLMTWAAKGGKPARILVEAADEEMEIERHVRAARRRGDLCIIDAGDEAETIRMGARLADRALVPVRFSPLSAYAAIATERMLEAEAGRGRRGRDWALVASAVTNIPSRVARSIEAVIARSPAQKLGTGLALRAAYEAPFMTGGTIFTLADEIAPGLDRARAEAAALAYEIGILGRTVTAEPAQTRVAVAA